MYNELDRDDKKLSTIITRSERAVVTTATDCKCRWSYGRDDVTRATSWPEWNSPRRHNIIVTASSQPCHSSCYLSRLVTALSQLVTAMS